VRRRCGFIFRASALRGKNSSARRHDCCDERCTKNTYDQNIDRSRHALSIAMPPAMTPAMIGIREGHRVIAFY
jgi:hypothetical protein